MKSTTSFVTGSKFINNSSNFFLLLVVWFFSNHLCLSFCLCQRLKNTWSNALSGYIFRIFFFVCLLYRPVGPFEMMFSILHGLLNRSHQLKGRHWKSWNYAVKQTMHQLHWINRFIGLIIHLEIELETVPQVKMSSRLCCYHITVHSLERNWYLNFQTVQHLTRAISVIAISLLWKRTWSGSLCAVKDVSPPDAFYLLKMKTKSRYER